MHNNDLQQGGSRPASATAQDTKYRAVWARENEAARIAARCTNAYSFYAFANWPKVAEACLIAGFSPAETETILRSKITRWARDAWNGRTIDGKYPAKCVADYLKRGGVTRAEIERWTRESFKPDEIARLNADDLRLREDGWRHLECAPLSPASADANV